MNWSTIMMSMLGVVLTGMAVALPPREGNNRRPGQGPQPGQGQRPNPGGQRAGQAQRPGQPQRPNGSQSIGQGQRPSSNPGNPSPSRPKPPGNFNAPGLGQGNRGGQPARPGAGNANFNPGGGSGGFRPGAAGRPGSPHTRPGSPSFVADNTNNIPHASPPFRPGGSGPGGRPGQRPDRPDITFPNRPSGNRPSGNRPNIDLNRPNVNINRPVVVNRPVNNVTNVTNQNTIINQNIVNQRITNQRNYNQNNFSNFNNYSTRTVPGYYSRLHHQWQPTTAWARYQPLYSNYYANNLSYTSAWQGGGVARYAYVNPFLVTPAVVNIPAVANAQAVTNLSAQVYDYSQPIRMPAADHQETNDELVRSEQAIRRFDDARELFRRGEYGRSNDAIDEAIRLLPSDPTLHQLRGLILFARQRYQEAAAAIYSVLAISPGWDWETVSKLYDDPQRYSEQLDELQKYVTAHPDATDAQFLLAYQATVIGDLAAAESQFALVHTAKPDDRLIENLLAGVRSSAEQATP